jgi:hypothetical protein
MLEHGQGEAHVSLAAGPVTGGGRADGAVALPGLEPVALPARLPRLRGFRVTVGPAAGRAALAALILGALLVVLVAVAGPSVLSPRSTFAFPGWESGPLGLLVPRVLENPKAIGIGFSVVLLAMFVAYIVALAAVRTFSTRTLVAVMVALHAILLLTPPLQLNDVFNYLGYAHLGGLHQLNPYSHVIKQESFDPVYRFASWDNLRSPYGPLFTALTYPLAFLSLPVAYWIIKVATVLLSLSFLGLIWQCARRLGRDPRWAVALVALNPIYLIYAVGGFHNDFFMLVPMAGAISLLLAGRYRWAGAVAMLAVAVKFTAVLLVPFLIVAAASRSRRLQVAYGAVLGAVPLVAMSLILFGLSIPNLAQQSSLLTGFSIPNIVGLVIGAGGGANWLLRVATGLVVLVVAHQLYRARDWLAGAGWATVALLASLGWLMPWYVIWVLPLAALASSVRLRRVAIAGTLFLILSFMPATNLYMSEHNLSALSSPVGRAAVSLQDKLEQ